MACRSRSAPRVGECRLAGRVGAAPDASPLVNRPFSEKLELSAATLPAIARFTFIFALALVLGVGGASAVPSASTPSGHSFAAIADASVLAGRMQQNFGGAKDLVVGPGTRSRALMRFRLHGLRGFVLGADLRVFVRSGRGAALAARVAGKKWTESRVV